MKTRRLIMPFILSLLLVACSEYKEPISGRYGNDEYAVIIDNAEEGIEMSVDYVTFSRVAGLSGKLLEGNDDKYVLNDYNYTVDVTVQFGENAILLDVIDAGESGMPKGQVELNRMINKKGD